MKNLNDETVIITAAILLILCTLLCALWLYRIRLYALMIDFPRPKHRVLIERNVMISMPDGTKLATDIYRPKSHHKYPVILIRTPYNKSGRLQPYRQMSELFASQGYAVIVQDVRGKYRSEGKFYPYAYEALDGHTTVMWAGEASWSNGKVALVGLSYPGSCAWLAARYKSPYLRTIITMFTTQDTYSVWVDDGVPYLKGPLTWLAKYCGKKENKRLTAKHLEPVLWHLPVSDLDALTVKHKIPFYREYLTHIRPDSFWEEISGHQGVGNLDVSAYIIGGWYDPFLKGTIEDYQRMNKAPENSKNHQSRLVIGPWAHNPAQKFKGIELGKNANFQSLLLSSLEWLDIWLKEKKHAMEGISKVRYFIMGKNTWEESTEWPPQNSAYEKLFLSMEEKDFNHLNGLLSSSPPETTQKNRFTYSPRDPVLFRGGYLMRTDSWIAPIVQDEIIARDEVLIYATPPLEEDLVYAGDAKLILYVSSQAVDTDFSAKICDVYPNGKAYNLSSGFIRMRFRESLERPEAMEPNKIYRIEITLKAVANAFLKNHRIQLQITSSDFPVHNRNLNTGLNCETTVELKEVEQTIYTGGQYESHLLLPVLKNH